MPVTVWWFPPSGVKVYPYALPCSMAVVPSPSVQANVPSGHPLGRVCVTSPRVLPDPPPVKDGLPLSGAGVMVT